MKYIDLDARAKINLSLDVTGKRSDGYHYVRMIMQTIALSDKIRVEESDERIRIITKSVEIPDGPENICFKAAKLFLESTGISKGVNIYIEKNIPVAAGLAGGSTDAAAVLKGLNSLFDAGLSTEEMKALGEKAGADVPFCITGGTALAEGIGEIITPLPDFSGIDLLLVKPKVSVSTAWVYTNLKHVDPVTRPDTELLLDAVAHRRADIMAANMKNVLESVTIPHYPEVDAVKKVLVELGAAGSMMSGSGPSVFGIFKDRAAAAKAFEQIKGNPEWDSFITKTA